MMWSDVVAIINQLITQSNSFTTAVGGALVNGRFDYQALANKPTINGMTIVGNQSSEDLAIGGLPGTEGGNTEATIITRAEQIAQNAAAAALAGKADASALAEAERLLATKLTAMPTNLRGVFANGSQATELRNALKNAYDGGDATMEGAQILVLSGPSANTVTISTLREGVWNDTVIGLNVNGGGVQKVDIRAILGPDGGSQIAAITIDGVTHNIYAPKNENGEVAIDITLDEEASDVRVPSSRCVRLALDEKADASALANLAKVVAEKADEAEVEALGTRVKDVEDALDGKADTQALENLASSVSDQGRQVGDLDSTVRGHTTAIGNNAKAIEELERDTQRITGDMEGKADKSDTYTKGEVDSLLENAGTIKGIKVDGEEVKPDDAGMVNLVDLRGGKLEGLFMNGREQLPDSDGKVNLSVVEGVRMNGQMVGKDAEGNVNLEVEIPEVDATLDAESTNAVQNAAVTTALNQLQNPTFNADVEEVDGGQQVTLSTASGQQVAQFVVTGGGGGGESSTSKILLTAQVDNAKVKEGGSATLSWYYNHVNADGVADGVAADITVTVKRGAVVLHEETMASVSPSEAAHKIILDAWLSVAGTVGVTIRANAVDGGVSQSKQYYVPVTVVALQLLLTNSAALIAGSMNGGFANGDTVVVTYSLKGGGTKEVLLYVDGLPPMSQTVTKSGTTNGQFAIAASTLQAGSHTLQLVAENDGLLSESTYINVLKAGAEAPFVGLLFVRDDGMVSADQNRPVIAAGQYAPLNFDYFAYDPASTIAHVEELRGGVVHQAFTVPRTRQTYSTRLLEAGTMEVAFRCGTAELRFGIEVTASSIDISKATAGLLWELTAAGRSNEESDPAHWESGEVRTAFSGFDWKSSGWDGDALVMRNGARAEISYQPFHESADPATNGKTIEIEFRVSNVIDNEAVIISCLDAGKGFKVTGSQAELLTGSRVTYTDEEGEEQTRVVGVQKTFAEDTYIKLALVIGPRTKHRLMEMYINGTREKADIYNVTDNFVQLNPAGITIDSASADVEVRVMRVYDRALTDDELVDNYIVDRPSVADMVAKYQDNDVLENGEYDITKILARGRGVVHFVRPNGLDEVNSANNKKTDFATNISYYSPFGAEWDLQIEGCYMRIQGTSSTKYPRKNYRIYLLKPSGVVVKRRDASGQFAQVVPFTGYAFRSSDREAPLICLKADYSDSSMTTNTGGAKLFDAMMRELGLTTPPQDADEMVRQSIDGFPVDVFATDTLDTTNAVRYYGQYNFNHDKDSSQNIFGHVNLGEGGDFSGSMALEALNNSFPLDLYQAAGSDGSMELSRQLANDFDGAFEFNYPKDKTWATCSDAHRAAISRLMGWIHDCVAECASLNGLDVESTDYSDSEVGKFVSPKFKAEAENYFVMQHLLTYYAFTDYFMCVDQRAKNILLRTFDLEHWYFTYYDGDCQLGMRNDSFLAYRYTLNRETWDADKSKYGFEGHDSWLWCLVLANYGEELKEAVRAMRIVLTNDRVLQMLNQEQMGNWCERAYNKSGEFKYILPATEGVTVIQNGVTTEGVKYPFIYALNGTNYSHRVHTVLHRFALLDAKYGCDTFRGDNVEMYLARQASDPAGVIMIRSYAPYYFDWNTKNGHHSDPQQAEAGDVVRLTFEPAITVNDPVDVYGASCMEEIDLSGVAGSMQNGINLNRATLLREIHAAAATPTTQTWFFNFDLCTRLRLIDCTGHMGVKTGTSSSTEFNVGTQTRLEELLLGGTGIQSVTLAQGAPLTRLVLPATTTVLTLRYLPLLTAEGLTIEGYGNISTLNFAACPGLDWTAIAAMCPNLYRLRVEGIDMDDDGTVLHRYKAMRGVDENGNAVPQCQLVGTVRLTKYVEEEVYEEFVRAYPQLTIHQPQYTMIQFDENVADDANVTNWDNKTGYAFDKPYEPSGHIKKILSLRHRVLAKQTSAGVAHYYPLHDEDSAYFADQAEATNCTPAKVDGTQGDVMMYEPGRWYKGINDRKNRKHYSCYSSLPFSTPPATPEAKVLSKEELLADSKSRQRYKLLTNAGELASCWSSDSGYDVMRVDVSGYKRVRFPSVIGQSQMGSLFLDKDGRVMPGEAFVVDTLSGGFENGMYVILDVPAGAAELYFTASRTAEFDKVVLSNSPRIEDMEPTWVWDPACLVGVTETVNVNGKLRSVLVSSASQGSLAYSDFKAYCGTGYDTSRRMQMIDYHMHNAIANLFFAAYGRRDSQAQCGAGSDTNGRAMNGTLHLGMKDTVNPDRDATGAWYWKPGASQLDPPVLTSIANNNVLGYQDLQGNKAEWMDGVAVNPATVDGVWHITQPDGTVRKVKGSTTSGIYIRDIAHGLFMDTIMVGANAATASTYYADMYYYSGTVGRVVYRSHYYASSSGGVSYAYEHFASSSSYAHVGSRLAFRGKIEKAASVQAYLAMSEIA